MYGVIVIGGSIGLGPSYCYETPQKLTYDLPKNPESSIKYVKFLSENIACIINDLGDIFYTGTNANTWTGGHQNTNKFSVYNLILSSNELTEKIISSNLNSALFLTNSGRIFGYGLANRIGEGTTSSDLISVKEISGLNDKEIIDFSVGTDFYVVVSSDGKVYGTGLNSSGTLGRWIGIDRTSPNSRYKTAFNWVECPELEL